VSIGKVMEVAEVQKTTKTVKMEAAKSPPGTSVTTYRPIQCLIPEDYTIFTEV